MHDKNTPIDLTTWHAEARQSFWQGVLVGVVGALLLPFIYSALIGA